MNFILHVLTRLIRDRRLTKPLKQRSGKLVLFQTEALEERRLLSATHAMATPVAMEAVAAATTVVHARAHVEFTANLGNFTAIAPATDLVVSINWGDGKVTSGHLKADGIVGIDEINFEVDGSHRYAHPGTYQIQVTVTKPGPTPNKPFIVAQFHDQAVVAPRPTR